MHKKAAGKGIKTARFFAEEASEFSARLRLLAAKKFKKYKESRQILIDKDP